MTTKTKIDYAALYAEADAAGQAAAEAAIPTPMVVGEETSPFSGVLDYSKPTYFEPEGLCGFAWVKFAGNTGWARWAKKEGYARPSYSGGYMLSVRGYGQSVTRKEAYAQAFADVLREAGVTAYAESRLD